MCSLMRPENVRGKDRGTRTSTSGVLSPNTPDMHRGPTSGSRLFNAHISGDRKLLSAPGACHSSVGINKANRSSNACCEQVHVITINPTSPSESIKFQNVQQHVQSPLLQSVRSHIDIAHDTVAHVPSLLVHVILCKPAV